MSFALFLKEFIILFSINLKKILATFWKAKYLNSNSIKKNTLVFLFCELTCNNKIIASASGIWKILKVKPSKLGPDS